MWDCWWKETVPGLLDLSITELLDPDVAQGRTHVLSMVFVSLAYYTAFVSFYSAMYVCTCVANKAACQFTLL